MPHSGPVLAERFGLAGGYADLAGPARAEHAHAEIELNLALGPGVRYLFAGRAIDFPAGRWLAYWAAIPHAVLDVARPTRMYWFTVPVATFLAWDEGGLAQRLLHGELVAEPRARAGSGEAAADWVALLHGDAARRRLATLEIEAAARRLGLSCSALSPAIGAARASKSGRAVGHRGSSGAVEVMATWLAERYRDDIDVDDCAQAAGLHPNYAMTLFRRTTGSTVWQYLTQLRLAHAQRLLLTTRRAVLEIALDAGFGSQARFYVAFKQAFGTTPAALRRENRIAD